MISLLRIFHPSEFSDCFALYLIDIRLMYYYISLSLLATASDII